MASRMAPWHLRQFYRRSTHRKGDDESFTKTPVNMAVGGTANGNGSNLPHTQSAHSIFSCAPSSYFVNQSGGFTIQDAKIVKGVVDGQEVVFQLREDVSQLPTIDRAERFNGLNFKALNCQPSAWHVRFRFFLIHLNLPEIKIFFIGVFMAMNFLYAGLWFIEEGKCCDDPSMTFLEIFDYAIQTSTTIGYGGYVPIGIWSNFLVVMISLMAIMLIAIYSGLLYFKFSAPVAKIQFSNVMTLSNVNGLPCMELRLGNCDTSSNNLIDVVARLSYQYTIKYMDEKGQERQFGQTEELKLLSDRRYELNKAVWTLRHVVDEHSPLFGLDLLEPPGNSIFQFDICINAIQKVTGAPVFAHTAYEVQDLMIGHRFVDQIEFDRVTKKGACDFSKMDDTVPHPVWYPTARCQAEQKLLGEFDLKGS